MRDVTLSEDAVEALIGAARLGLVMMDKQRIGTEDRYERNNVAGQIRRAEDAIQDAEWQSMLAEFTPDAEQMSTNAEKKRAAEDIHGSFSDDKANFIEGRR